MKLLAILAVTAVALLLAAAAQAVPPGSTILVDRPSGFGALPFDGVGDSKVGANALSADGCFVVFSTHSDVLSPSDDDAAENIFRLDLCRPGLPLAQVNTSSDGTPAEALSDSEGATISTDGRYVALGRRQPGARRDGPRGRDLRQGPRERHAGARQPRGRPERQARGAGEPERDLRRREERRLRRLGRARHRQRQRRRRLP
jgi:hypothetical protein